MIVSASRRTDIPAFYAPWFMNRVRAGHCLVPNPFNRKQVSRISLLPADVDAIVFWTRDPRPLMPHLRELDDLGHRYLFLVTLVGNPRSLDPGSPPLPEAVQAFRDLADTVGPHKVIWRYDPIVHTRATDNRFHRDNFHALAASLAGHTSRCILSFVEFYRKTVRRLQSLPSQGSDIRQPTPDSRRELLSHLAHEASLRGMELMLCAGGEDVAGLGVLPGKCIDGDYISKHLAVEIPKLKDRNQRALCGCAPSRDVGMYDTCLFGCRYCYATGSFERARENHRRHDPSAAMLLPPPP